MAIPQDQETTFIGKCNFRGNERIFGIKARDRRQHMYVIGKTGVGKTALLKNLALQDIYAGRGIAIIDPHGEFVEEVLAQIPESRINDVVYFNPVDSEYPIGFNVLEVPDMKYRHLVVSDLLGIFTKIWANVWSARMEYILQNCILALIDTPGSTLLGVPRLLTDKDYRKRVVDNITDPVVRSFWVNEYEAWREQFRNEAIVPIQNKVGQFLNTSFVRNIVGQPKSTMNVAEIMNSGKILLANVSKGKVGEDNSALLGAMLITKVQLAAMERVRILEEDRRDFYLYVDEFQNFATDSFATILSEARKYRLNLLVAHQYIGQLETDVSSKVRDAVFGNVGTMITFRVGAGDAEFLEKEFEPEFMIQDLINLPNHHIYLKLMVDGVTSRPFSGDTLEPLKYQDDALLKEKIIQASRAQYGRPREAVEAQITEWSAPISSPRRESAPQTNMNTGNKDLFGAIQSLDRSPRRDQRDQNEQSRPPRFNQPYERPQQQNFQRSAPQQPQARRFEPRQEQRQEQREERPPQREPVTPVQNFQTEPVVRAPQEHKPMPLSALRSKEETEIKSEERREIVRPPRERMDVREQRPPRQQRPYSPAPQREKQQDLRGLRQLLEESKKETSKKQEEPTKQEDTTGDNNIIKPGDVVRL